METSQTTDCYDGPLAAFEDQKIAIVVVGNEAESKSRIADELARGIFGSNSMMHFETTASGVRIVSSQCSAAVAVVDTLPFFAEKITTRVWVSQNSLRRILLGKLVFVVCVATAQKSQTSRSRTGCLDLRRCSRMLDTVHTTFLLFQAHTKLIAILVDEGNVKDVSKLLLCANFRALKKEGLYRYFQHVESGAAARQLEDGYGHVNLCTESNSLVNSVVEEIDNIHKNDHAPSPSFLGEEPSSDCTGKIGLWEPERVILFGRTGGGKSTLAQMLTTGKLDPGSQKFHYTSSITGGTKEIEHGEGRGWFVVDTPGFGEPSNNLQTHSTISTEAAQAKIEEYVQSFDGTYSHYLYVTKIDRLDKLEKLLWTFFVELFKDNRSAKIPSHFSVVISGVDESWIRKERVHLEEFFEGCTSFLGANFPDVHEDDPEWEAEDKEVREMSLRELENKLAKSGREDAVCDLETFSGFRRNKMQRALFNLPTGMISTVAGPAITRATNLLLKNKQLILQPF